MGIVKKKKRGTSLRFLDNGMHPKHCYGIIKILKFLSVILLTYNDVILTLYLLILLTPGKYII